jgi:hypothetical protein
MPLISAFAGAAARAYGFLSGGIKYFFGYYNAGSSGYYKSILDADKNLVIAGELSSGSAIVKISPVTDSIVWQKQAVDCVSIRGVDSDSSNNLYFLTTNSTYSFNPVFVKVDTNGAIQWQKYLSGSSYSGASSIYTSSAGFCVAGNAGTNGLTVKYNSAGTLQWQKIIDSATDNIVLNNIAADSSGNVYSAGLHYGGSGEYSGLLVKYNSAGTLQWQNSIPPTDGSGTGASIEAITCDSADNIYVAYEGRLLIKYDSTGSIIWEKRLPAGNPTAGLATDSENNVYAADNTYIYKLNASGTPQFRITISNSGNLYNFATEKQDYLIGAKGGGLIVKLPLDGSKTGTFTVPSLGSVTYSVASFSATDTSVTVSDPGFSDASGSGTSLNSSITMANLSNTYTSVNI